MRVAAFDCGTNSLRLLIADAHDGSLTDVVRTLELVRLGQGVDRTGRFADDALARTLETTQRYADLCREHGVERMRFVATSATRDAANRDEFLNGVREILGVRPEVISGEEEAALSFRGAVSVLDSDAVTERLVVDLGGGSTELVLGDGTPLSSFSMDVGCVRLTERHLHFDPPTEAQRAAVRADVNSALDEAAGVVDLSRASELVGVAGTVTTVTAHALRLPSYQPDVINGTRLPVERVLEACADLASMPREQRAALPYMHPGRVDVIASGALVWSVIVGRVQGASGIDTVVTSEHDILDGTALSLAD